MLVLTIDLKDKNMAGISYNGEAKNIKCYYACFSLLYLMFSYVIFNPLINIYTNIFSIELIYTNKKEKKYLEKVSQLKYFRVGQ